MILDLTLSLTLLTEVQVLPAFTTMCTNRRRAVSSPLRRALQKSASVDKDLWLRVEALLKNPSSSWATIGARPGGHTEWL